MIIGRANTWHRPYYVLVNDRWYQVKTVKFYKDNEVLVSSQSGWLETRHGDIKDLEIPTEEIKLKRKEKFDGTVFIVSRGKEWCGNDTMADLYLPADMFNIHFVRHEIAYETQVRAVFEGEQGIYISRYVKSLDIELQSIRNEYDETVEKISGYNLKFHTEETMQNIDKLKELAEKFIAEQQRVRSLTIDDIEI